MIHDLSLLVRFGTGNQGVLVSFGSYHGDEELLVAIYGCPDSRHPPRGKWLGTARPHIRPGTEAAEWTRHAGICQRGLSRMWVYVCECVRVSVCVCVCVCI